MQHNSPTVAHFVNTYLFSHGTWIYNQIRYLNCWRPIILCQDTENLDVFPAECVYSLNSLPKHLDLRYRVHMRLRMSVPYFQNAIEKEQAQLLHAHFGYNGYFSLSLAQTSKIPLITTFYGFDLSRLPQKRLYWRKLYQQLFKQGHLFLVEGSFMRQQLLQLGCSPEKARVQHLGVDLSRLPYVPRKIDDDGVVRILAAATFTEKKGLVYAVEAFARLSQTHSNVHMTIIGDARNRAHEKAIKKQLLDLVARYRIEDKVTFFGYQPYEKLIVQFYRHHIFLSPSVQAVDGDNEGGAPVTIIEASASGMPVVSTIHCDIPEVIIDGKSGFLVPEKDVDSLIERLEYLLNLPEIWASFGSNGRKHIEDHYDVISQSEKLEKIYSYVRDNN
jgi:colanic acid/amylovoran biosynthesis glycosyltransferase